MKRKYNSSEAFYNKKWNELKQWAKKEHINLKDNGVTKYSFKTQYDSYRMESKHPLREMQYSLKYNTTRETAKAEMAFLKASGLDKGVRLKDLKKMETSEFYDKYKNEIEAYRDDMKTLGLSSYQANRLLAIHFFGSM